MTRLCFWVLGVLLLVLLAATWLLPRHTIAGENGGWRPKMPFVPKDLRRAFATAWTERYPRAKMSGRLETLDRAEDHVDIVVAA